MLYGLTDQVKYVFRLVAILYSNQTVLIETINLTKYKITTVLWEDSPLYILLA